jgi:hypothetical protein
LIPERIANRDGHLATTQPSTMTGVIALLTYMTDFHIQAFELPEDPTDWHSDAFFAKFPSQRNRKFLPRSEELFSRNREARSSHELDLDDSQRLLRHRVVEALAPTVAVKVAAHHALFREIWIKHHQ